MALLLTRCFRQSALQQMALRSAWLWTPGSLTDSFNLPIQRWVLIIIERVLLF
jgi:hypothetical protein